MLRNFFLLSAAACALPILSAQSTWTGANSSDWSDDGNWTAGTPSNTGTGVLTGTVTVNEPNIGSGATLRYLNIESGGWTINSSGGTGDLGFNPVSNRDAPNELNITGDGLTVINANVIGASGYNGPNMFVDDGSKLVINGNLVNPTGRSWSMRGSGYHVFNGSVPSSSDFSPEPDNGVFGSYIYNNATGTPTVGRYNDLTISSGNVIGGTTPTLIVYQYSLLTIQDGARMVIGGDGATVAEDGSYGGAAVSTMTIRSNDTDRSGVSFGSGAQLEMDLVAPGSSDQIILGNLDDDFNLNGATLALYGDGPAAGSYTLLEETVVDSIYNGTFGTVLYNDSPIDTEIFTLNYNPTSITLDVVPEPSTYAMLLGLAAIALVAHRRRRA